ncbi:MAG: penicillin-binding protein 2, partial [Syntrophales bacterium LBB04]|nr:penicillin-binding protein 2 [Syntrophales bacterium LBB04]
EQKGKIPVSKKNIEIISHALWGVVNENGGTGHALKRKEAGVCGKTGTAQVIGLPDDEEARKRRKILTRHRDHALFACYAPYKSPEIAIAVIVEHSGHGGSVAAPIARKIIDAYFEHKQQVTNKSQPVVAIKQN